METRYCVEQRGRTAGGGTWKGKWRRNGGEQVEEEHLSSTYMTTVVHHATVLKQILFFFPELRLLLEGPNCYFKVETVPSGP